MINVIGLDKFKEVFEKYENNYVLIGGSACAVVFDEIGESFRATRDLDIVLIVENISDEFTREFWGFIKDGEYYIEADVDKRCFYRFTKPQMDGYPQIIELFSRNRDIKIEGDAHIIPIHITDEVSSLSAILLNDDYYNFMLSGKRIINGLSVLDEKYLIQFKTKAWCELIDRRNQGEEVQSRHIKKHFKDVSNLVSLLPKNTKVVLNGMVKQDMARFVEEILISEFVAADVDVRRLHNILKEIYLLD